MQQILTIIKNDYLTFCKYGINMVLIWVAFIYLFLKEKNGQKRNLLYLVMTILFLLLNPFIVNNLITFGTTSVNYWTAYTMVPSTVFIAYAMTKLVMKENNPRKQGFLIAGFIIVLFVSTNFESMSDGLSLIVNKYKIPEEIIEIQKIMGQHGEVYVIAPRDVGEWLREYDSSVRILGGDGEKWYAIGDMSEDWKDADKIYSYAVSYGVTCIVTPKNEEGEILDPTRFGLVGQTENYYIYLK